MHCQLFSQIRNRVPDRSLPICRWNITDDEFRELQRTLKRNPPASTNPRDSDAKQENDAAKYNFLIWCSEQYRRNLSPGATWEEILDPLRLKNVADARAKWIQSAEERLGRTPLNQGTQYHKRVYVEGGIPIHLFDDNAASTYLDAIRYLVQHNAQAYSQGIDVWRVKGLPIPNGQPGGKSYWSIFLDLAWSFVRNLLEQIAQASAQESTKNGQVEWLLKNAGLGIAATDQAKEFLGSLLDEDEVKKRSQRWWPSVKRILVLDRLPCLSIEIDPKIQFGSPAGFPANPQGKIFLYCDSGSTPQRISQYRAEAGGNLCRIPMPLPRFTGNAQDALGFRLKHEETFASQNVLESLDCDEEIWTFSKDNDGRWIHNSRLSKCSFPAIIALNSGTVAGTDRGCLQIGQHSRTLVEVAQKQDLPPELQQRLAYDFPTLQLREAKTSYGSLLQFLWKGEPIPACIGWPGVNESGAEVVMADSLVGPYQVTPTVMPQTPVLHWFRVRLTNQNGVHEGPRRRILVLPSLDIKKPEAVAPGCWKIKIEEQQLLGIAPVPVKDGARWCDVLSQWEGVEPHTLLKYRWGNDVSFMHPSPASGARWMSLQGDFPWDMALPELRDKRIHLTNGLNQSLELRYTLQLWVNHRQTSVQLRESIFPTDGSESIALDEIGDCIIPRLFQSTNAKDVSIRLDVCCDGVPVGRRIMIHRFSSSPQGDRYFLFSPLLGECGAVIRDDQLTDGNRLTDTWLRIPSSPYGMNAGVELWDGLHKPALQVATPDPAHSLDGLRSLLCPGNPKTCTKEIHGWLRANPLDQENRTLIERTFLEALDHQLPPVSLWILTSVLSDDETIVDVLSGCQSLRDRWHTLVRDGVSPVAFDWRLVRPNVIMNRLPTAGDAISWFVEELSRDYGFLPQWTRAIPPATGTPIYQDEPSALQGSPIAWEKLGCAFESSLNWMSNSGIDLQQNASAWKQAMIWFAWFSVHATREEYNRHLPNALLWFKQMEAIFQDWKSGVAPDAQGVDWFNETFRTCQMRALAG